LRNDDTMLDPEFFLASVSDGWEPQNRGRLPRARAGRHHVYEKNGSYPAFPLALYMPTEVLGALLLANPLRRQNAFRVAVETLLGSRRIRGRAILRVPQSGGDLGAIRQLIASTPLDTHYSRVDHGHSRNWKHHAHLPLTASYEQFLMGLGSTTRHNFRYYRKRFEASGHSFIECLSTGELLSAALALRG